MAYWIKITYDRNTYVIDLDRVSSFIYTPNGRISFCLPDGGNCLIINQQSNSEAYQKLLDYIEKTTGETFP